MLELFIRRLLPICAALWIVNAHADTVAPAQGVVNLASSASVEITRDWLTLMFAATRDGADAATVQLQLKQALDAALTEAKKNARPGQTEVQTGSFNVGPRYSNKGVISGWQGRAELVVEGRDMQAIGALAGRITTMTIARVAYSLSRDLRERLEGEVAAQAITRFRAKAADYAKQFGYAGHTVREVNVSSVDAPQMTQAPMMRSNATMSAAADESLPIEPGKGFVSITVSGSIQMQVK